MSGSIDLVFGINPVREALRAGRKAFELFAQTNPRDHRIPQIIALAESAGIPVRRRERPDLDRLAASTHHQGVILRVAPFTYQDLDTVLDDIKSGAGLILALDTIQDPQNLGALIRSAACAGVQAVLIPKDRACGITPAVERASAGAVETVPVVQVGNLVQALEKLKQNGFWVYGLVGEAPDTVYQASFVGATVLAVGNEGDGIRPLVRSTCDHLVSIPQYGGVSSLNASVAGGIVLFEAARQRNQGEHTAGTTP